MVPAPAQPVADQIFPVSVAMLSERGEGAQATLLLERALEVEPGVEDFYRDLMAGSDVAR